MLSEADLLRKRLEREINARKAAEKILEEKSLELYKTNQELKLANKSLEELINEHSSALSLKEKEYSLLVEHADDLIYTIDEFGQFLSMNERGLAKICVTNEEICKMSYLDIIHPDYREDVFKFYTHIEENSISSSYYEFPMISNEGNILWIGQNVTRIGRKDGSHYYSGVARDITQRVDENIELKRSEEKYRSMMENMELGLMEVDSNGIIQKVYEKFCKMVKYESHELIGQKANSIFLDEVGKNLMEKHDKLREQGQEGVYELEILCKDGEKKWLLISGAPFYDDDGNFKGTLGIHLDISERKKLEKELISAREIAERAQEAEKEYLANMSHEIRNPIQGIIGMTELLNNTNLSELQRLYLNNIKNASELLSAIVSDVLDFNKIDSGHLEVTNDRFSVIEVFRNIYDHSISRLKNTKVRFLCDINPNVPKELYGDYLFLNQILMNLVGNAIKFTDEGYIQLNVRAEEVQDDIINLIFEVKDTGVGIPLDKMDTIFEKFNQAGSVSSKNESGVGLGLYIVKKLIDKQNGEIYVESKIDEGTCFSFTIPYKKVNSSEILKAAEHRDNFRLELLIAEDSELNRNYLRTILTQMGHNCTTSNNGLLALDESLKKRYDIILMDIRMPEMNGYDASIRIRSDVKNPNYNTPIIALTASALFDDKEHAIEAGMTHHMTKPFSKEQLLKVLRDYAIVSKNEFKGPRLISKFDSDYLDTAFEGEWSEVAELMRIFLRNMGKHLKLFEKYILNDDFDAIQKLIHKIKPGFKLTGLCHLHNEISKFEQLCQEKNEINNELRESLNNLILSIKSILPLVRGSIAEIDSFIRIGVK